MDTNFEVELVKNGRIVLGVDEVGRGPAAGPMVFAGVIYDTKLQSFKGLNDSKKVSENLRKELYSKIVKNCIFGLGVIWPNEIDKYGLSACFQIAISRVISSVEMRSKFDFLLLDGSLKFNQSVEWKSVIKGDEKFLSVAAASIVAKVFRDKIMVNYASEFPFRFDRHKAYLTKLHREEIQQFGLQRIHRHSYNLQK